MPPKEKRLPLIERPYAKRAIRWLDIKDKTFGKLTAKKMVGFIGPSSAWEFECECGNVVVRRGAEVKCYPNRQHCGCLSKKQFHGGSGKQDYGYWVRLRKEGKLDERWAESYPLFVEECWVFRDEENRFLNRHNRTGKLGKDNFFWANNQERYYETIDECVEALVNMRGLSRDEAYARTLRISRQRRFHLIWNYQGLCAMCRKPLGKYTHKCSECSERENAKKRKSNCARKDMPNLETKTTLLKEAFNELGEKIPINDIIKHVEAKGVKVSTPLAYQVRRQVYGTIYVRAAHDESKAQVIRDYAAQNPDATIAEIFRAVNEKGLSVGYQYVYLTLRNLKNKEVSAQEVATAHSLIKSKDVEALKTALPAIKGLVKLAGGFDHIDRVLRQVPSAKKLVDLLGGFEKAQSALEFLADFNTYSKKSKSKKVKNG